MRSRALTYAVVGLFTLGVLAAGWWTLLYLHKSAEGEGYRLHAWFDDATLLVEKSRVQVAGLPVGRIVAKDLDTTPPRPELAAEKRFARITVEMRREAVIYQNAVIAKKTVSLLGEFYLEIDPGTPFDPKTGKPHRKLGHGDEIRNTVTAVSVDEIMARFDETIPTLKGIAQDVRALTRAGGPIESILRNVDQTVATIADNREKITRMLDNAVAMTDDLRSAAGGVDEDFERVLGRVDEIAASLKTLIDDAGRAVSGAHGVVDRNQEKVAATVESIQAAAQKLDRTLTHLEDLAESVHRGEGTLGRLIHDDTLVRNVETTTGEAGRLIRSITRLRTIVGLRSEYNLLASTVKSYLAIRFQPRPDKYYLLEFVDDPRGEHRTTTRFLTMDEDGKPVTRSETEEEITDAFRFTFQFAKRLQFTDLSTTLRFGIKESTGGVGFDLSLMNDALEWEIDVFDPLGDEFPRVRLMFAWEFFKHLYLVGGIDDAFNPPGDPASGLGRDLFAGAQLRFDDEDLFALLFTGGGAISGGAR